MMRFSPAFVVSALSAVLPLTVSAAPFEFNVTAPAADIEKRAAAFDNARMTRYDITTGTTACGGRYTANDHVVALDSQQFGSGYPGPNCGKTIAITANGKTVNAQIVDKCPGCPYAGLDLTSGLFKQFAPLDTGVLTGSWVFV